MASPTRPDILLLSLSMQPFLDSSYASLFDQLAESASIKRAKKADPAIRYLDTNNPKAIIITDEGLTKRENAAVPAKVVSYVRNGGLAIIGLHFPSFARPSDINNLFGSSGFGLPWKSGDYHRTTFQLNPECVLPGHDDADADANAMSLPFPGPYSMKTLHIKDARPHEKIFIPEPEATVQSHVFAPGYVDQSQAAVAGARVGKGYLAYCGDVNGEEGSDEVILALCGI
jgi:hypothetical protein